MPAIFKRNFRVRHYECDAYGHLNNVNYLRYMQETALDASAAVGWDTSRYERIGKQWLIRESDIHYLKAIRWNDEIEITSYVVDFRRVQSRRRYEFRRDGELVAEANTNWVFLEMENQRPTTVPPEMIADFAPDGLADSAPSEKFPEQPRKPSGAFMLRKRVEWRDIDTVGHVNNAAYMSYCEDCSTQVGRDLGWAMRRMLDANFALVLRRFRIQYLLPAVLDDEVEITSWVSDVKRATAFRHYELRRVSDGEQLARAYAQVVFFDLAKQRPARVPEDFLEAFAENVSDESMTNHRG